MSAAQDWVEHLCNGGTTTWADFRRDRPAQGRTATRSAVPGAQQLELLRRLNLHSERPLSAELVARVLHVSAPGRGSTDLDLIDNGPPPRFGFAAVEPEEVGTAELLRVAASLVAQDLMAAPGPRFSRPLRLVGDRMDFAGDPWLTARWEASMRRRGVVRHRASGRGPVLVIATDPGRALGSLWTARAFGHGIAPWRAWLRQVESRDSLPTRADAAVVAEHWADRLGKQHVHVVTDPALVPDLTAQARIPRSPIDTPSHLAPSATQSEVARRVGAVLALHMHPDRRRLLLRALLLERLGQEATPALTAACPETPLRLRWLQQRADDIARRLRRGGYRVHGDLDDVATLRPGSGGPHADSALELMLGLLA